MDEERRKKHGFPFWWVCHLIPTAESRGSTSGDAPTSRENRPLPKPCNARFNNTLWVQNRSLRDCRQAGRQTGRDWTGIIPRHVQLRSGRCVEIWVFYCARRVLLLCWPLEIERHYEGDPRTLGAGRLSWWLIWLFCWYRASLTETSIVILSELAY